MHHPTLRPRRRPVATFAALVIVLSTGIIATGCSSATAPPSTTVPSGGTAGATTACTRPAPTQAPSSTPVAGSTSDWNVTSFDGTRIRVHWFPLATLRPQAGPGPHPTVLMGPGWGLAGDTDVNGTGILGEIPISALLDAGYNVLTWDPRGFGASGGQAEVDSPLFEGKDVSTLIDWVASRPGVQTDRFGDPRLGMVGGSYGGGIQFTTAAIDCRVDAIVPTIAWNSLTTSLFKADTLKAGWAGVLTNVASSAHLDPRILSSYHQGMATGLVDASTRAWYAARGPAQFLSQIHIPTLIIQGTVDTLFTLQEGVDNYEALRARGIPTAMQWFCGGHGVCLTQVGDANAPEQATLAWLKRYVQRDTSVNTGPGFTFVDQNGVSWSAPAYPPSPGTPVTATGSGTLPLVAGGGSGPVTATPSGQALGGLAGPITPAPANNAVNVPVTFTASTTHVVGAPHLTVTYHGTVPAGTHPTRVFAQLIDRSNGTVLGNQVTPIPVTLDGKTHTVTLPLEIVAYTATPSSQVALQLVATTVSYALPRLGGSVTFSEASVSLPTATGLTPVTASDASTASGS